MLQTIAMNMNRIIVAGKSNKTPQYIAIHIAATAPNEYKMAVETIKKMLKDNAASIDLEDIKTLFQDRYSHLKKYKSLKRNESHTALAALEALNEEKAFAAWQQRPKGFKGTCNFCGRYGHKGVDCFKRKSNDGDKKTAAEAQSKFGGKCLICGMPGHRKSECRRNLNDHMKKNMAALAQTMSLFGQKEDDDQDTHYNYSEEDDNESYDELGFLAMNVAGRDNGESKRMER